MTPLFSDADRQRIAHAVETAESTSNGEIVPYVVVRSAPYAAVPWRGGVFGAVAATSIAALARTLPAAVVPAFHQDVLTVLFVVGWGLLVAVAASRIPLLLRWTAGQSMMRHAVHQRALQAFVEEEVFATRDRTGILLFVSLLERRVEVLADAGINARVPDDDWHNVTERVRIGIANGQLADGLIDAVQQCGQLFARHGFDPGTDDRNERPDHLRAAEE